MKKIKLIALLAAAIVGIGIYQFLKEAGKPAEVPRTEVVVAAVNISSNQIITADMVYLQPVATEALLDSCVYELENVIGKAAASDIYAGEQISANRLTVMGDSTAETNTLANKISQGMRAVAVSVNAVTGFENMLKPGNRVDILVNLEYQREDEENPEIKVTETASGVLMENIEILAVGGFYSKDGATEYTTVTLHVTEKQMNLLNYCGSGHGVISMRLALRSPIDNEPVELRYLGFSEVMNEIGIKAEADNTDEQEDKETTEDENTEEEVMNDVYGEILLPENEYEGGAE